MKLPEKNTHALPVQLTILLPLGLFSDSESFLKSVLTSLPDVACRFYVLAMIDQENELETRRNLNSLLAKELSEHRWHLLTRKNQTVETLLTTAIQHRCDLLLVRSSSDFDIKLNQTNKIRLRNLLKKAVLPILIVPEEPVKQLKSKQSIVVVNPEDTSRLSWAFSMRCARLLSRKTQLIGIGKTENQTRDIQQLQFIRDRYWPLSNDHTINIELSNEKFQQIIEDQTQLHTPDIVIVPGDNLPSVKRSQITDSVKSLVTDSRLPVMIVHRTDWVKMKEDKLRPVFQSISDFDIISSPEDSPTPAYSEHHPGNLMLGYYSLDGLKNVFTKYGLTDSLARRGYPDFHLRWDSTEDNKERLRVFPTSNQTDEPLVDMVFRQEVIPAIDNLPGDFPLGNGPFLNIEWLCLQDPEKKYHDLETPLPGQKYPGLGLGWKVLIIIKFLARRIGAAAVYNNPEYYHTARFYHRYFKYINPELEGRLLAIDRDTFPSHVVDTSWAILHGLVLQDNSPAPWIGGPQILALDKDLEKYFNSTHYRDTVYKSMIENRFSLALDTMSAMIKDRTLYKDPGDKKQLIHGG